MKKHGLWNKETPPLSDVSFALPPLLGEDVDSHFKALANKQMAPYTHHAETLVVMPKCPPKPNHWIYKPGWTRYDPERGRAYSVPCPQEDAIVFDVETLVTQRNVPVLATAVTPKAW